MLTDLPVRGLGAVTGSTVEFFPYVSLYFLERSRRPRSSSLLQELLRDGAVYMRACELRAIETVPYSRNHAPELVDRNEMLPLKSSQGRNRHGTLDVSIFY